MRDAGREWTVENKRANEKLTSTELLVCTLESKPTPSYVSRLRVIRISFFRFRPVAAFEERSIFHQPRSTRVSPSITVESLLSDIFLWGKKNFDIAPSNFPGTKTLRIMRRWHGILYSRQYELGSFKFENKLTRKWTTPGHVERLTSLDLFLSVPRLGRFEPREITRSYHRYSPWRLRTVQRSNGIFIRNICARSKYGSVWTLKSLEYSRPDRCNPRHVETDTDIHRIPETW